MLVLMSVGRVKSITCESAMMLVIGSGKTSALKLYEIKLVQSTWEMCDSCMVYTALKFTMIVRVIVFLVKSPP